MSSPGASDWKVPPTTPASPASPAPNANTMTKTSWMRTPLAASMSRSSTPARIMIPMRVRLSSHHITMPITSAAKKITRRTIGYLRKIGSPVRRLMDEMSGVSIAPTSQSGGRIW